VPDLIDLLGEVNAGDLAARVIIIEKTQLYGTSALSENIAKFAPAPSQVAPSGSDCPGHISFSNDTAN
jgi:hypothetical protein